MGKNKRSSEQESEIIYSVEDIDIKELIPNVIDNFVVAIVDDHHTVILPPNINGQQFTVWNKGRGGVFSRDVLKYSRGIKSGKYVIIKEADKKFIARIISEEELFQFKTLKLASGQVKDMTYMFLKEIHEGESFTSTRLNFNDKEEAPITTEEEFIAAHHEHDIHDEEIENKPGSISLFAD